MNAPIRQICVGDAGVGFIIEYRRTADVFRHNVRCGVWGTVPVEPAGSGWGIVRHCGDDTTLWRRFVPWVGKLSPHRRRA